MLNSKKLLLTKSLLGFKMGGEGGLLVLKARMRLPLLAVFGLRGGGGVQVAAAVLCGLGFQGGSLRGGPDVLDFERSICG